MLPSYGWPGESFFFHIGGLVNHSNHSERVVVLVITFVETVAAVALVLEDVAIMVAVLVI
jgi:hypothetical protein